MIPDGSSRALLFQDGSSFLRSRWYDEAMARASREPKVVQARARMRSGGLRERVRYWYVLSVHMNRPGYFEYKLASVLERLTARLGIDITGLNPHDAASRIMRWLNRNPQPKMSNR